MALNLSPRQRAMLKDMGVRVWLPQPPAALPKDMLPAHAVQAQNAINLIAESAANTKAKTHFSKDTGPTAINRSPSSALPLTSATSPWQWGTPYPLYAEHAVQATYPGRWLVLAEMPLEALQGESFEPLAGEAGQLLSNMLRAAQLDQATHTTLVPWVRLVSAAPASHSTATHDLADILRSTRPDIVLLMGRLAAQAVLASDLPLAKLRGQVHHLPGEPAPVPTIVTYDASYLLRNRADKAKAWDDLCLAMACLKKA